MEALQIMPIMAQNQSRFNLGEYAEEAAIIQDEPTVQPSVNFLEEIIKTGIRKVIIPYFSYL